MNSLILISRRLRARLAGLGEHGRKRSSLLRRVPPLNTLLEWAARIGFGARGFVYLSVGLLTLLASADLVGDAVGTRGAIIWLGQRPLGRLWLILLGLGLAAFVQWRVLQSVFDADREGASRHAVRVRFGQAVSALAYAALAVTTFRFVAHLPRYAGAVDVAASRDAAAAVVALPYGHWLLAGVGLAILAVGLANVSRAWREDFTEYLACSEKLCRRVAPLARVGYIARGLAYLPLAVLVIIAGLRSRASGVTSFGSALDAVEGQPGGAWALGLTALGLIAFGVFSFIEARFRRIRPPRDFKPI